MLPLIVLILFLNSFNYIQCKSLAEFCTHESRDYEINYLQSMFSYGDKVYIRVGTKLSKYWVYDTKLGQVLTQPVSANQYYPIVEHVAAVICDDCGPKAANLLIAIGRKDTQSYRSFATFRIQSDDSLVRIRDQNELPPNWQLRPYGEFDLNAPPYWGFFPENVVTFKSNFSNIHGFTFFGPKRIFLLKYYIEDKRFFIYRKINRDGSLTNWKELGINDQYPYSLNSIFPLNDSLYTINNHQNNIFHRIDSEVIVKEMNGVLQFSTRDIDIEARMFFNCFDKPSTVTTTTKTTTTGKPSEMEASDETTATRSTTSSSVSSQTNTITTSADTITSESTSPVIIVQTGSSDNDISVSSEDKSENNDDDDEDFNIVWLLLFFLIVLIICVAIILVLSLCLRNKKRESNTYYNKHDSQSNRDFNESNSFNSSTSMRSLDDSKQNVGINSSEFKDSMSETSLRSTRDPNSRIGFRLSEVKDTTSAVSLRSTK